MRCTHGDHTNENSVSVRVSDVWEWFIYSDLYADRLACWLALRYAYCRGVCVGCGQLISSYPSVMTGGGGGCGP